MWIFCKARFNNGESLRMHGIVRIYECDDIRGQIGRGNIPIFCRVFLLGMKDDMKWKGILLG